VGGWLVGIPFTSRPSALFLAVSPGPRFAAAAAAGTLAGTASQAAFCLAYAWVAQTRSWAASLAAAAAAFLAATALLNLWVPPPAWSFPAMIGVLLITLRLMPGRDKRPARRLEFPRWDLPLRMVVATVFVVGLTEAAPLLGARLAGLLAPYPLYATVLAVFAHRLHGSAPAVGVLRGLLLGLFAFASFFFLVAALLVQHGIVIAFGAAILAALTIQGATLTLSRRLGTA
ncbi:MAG TPA: hypothetical protein VEW68_06555, partial [Patescibacteria group bacterium]|nr:hypothetical protein [Patescibacteria group bacterium]